MTQTRDEPPTASEFLGRIEIESPFWADGSLPVEANRFLRSSIRWRSAVP
jgi:hypothetical protein